MAQNNQITSSYGLHEIFHFKIPREKTLGQVFHLPLSSTKSKKKDSSKLDSLPSPNDFLYCRKITPRKSLSKTQRGFDSSDYSSVLHETDLTHENMPRIENPKVIILKRKLHHNDTSEKFSKVSPQQDSKNFPETVRVKSIDPQYKAESSTNISENSFKINEKLKLSLKLQINNLSLSQRPYLAHIDQISPIQDVIEAKTYSSSNKFKYSTLDPLNSYQNDNPYLQPNYSKNGSNENIMFHDTSNRPSLNTRKSKIAPPLRSRLNSIGIYLVTKDSYSSRKSKRLHVLGDSILNSERSENNLKAKDHSNSTQRQNSCENKEDNNTFHMGSEKEKLETRKSSNHKFNMIFNLMTGIEGPERRKSLRHSSTDYSKVKNIHTQSNTSRRFFKPKRKIKFPNREQPSQEILDLEISKVKLYSFREIQSPFQTIYEKDEKTENKPQKMRVAKNRKIDTNLKDLSYQNSELKTANKTTVGIEKNTSQELFKKSEIKTLKESKKYVKKHSKLSKKKEKEENNTEIDLKKSITSNLLEMVTKQTSTKLLEKRLLMQQGKNDSLQGWGDMEYTEL